MTLSLTAATRARMAGSPSIGMISRAWPSSRIHDAKAATTYVSFGPFIVHHVAIWLVEDWHEANKATTGSFPVSVKYP